MTEAILDGEELALRTLARNASRIRTVIGGAAVTVGLIVGLPAYWVVRAVMFDILGINISVVTAAIAYGVPCGLGMFLGRMISRALIRARQEVWIVELAQQHGVPADRLREASLIW
jgi:hypothetical protein